MNTTDRQTDRQTEFFNYWESAHGNYAIFDSIAKAEMVLNRKGYSNIWVSISGGADSDIMIDICSKLSADVQYVFFDTGIEYAATLDHLNFLEQKYRIIIHREKALVPVPLGCKRFGQPFLSKQVSEFIERLQKHNFQWEDESLTELLKKYPKCKAALRWWCNDFGENSRFNISYNKRLKEFILSNPPTFAISNQCCDGAKKNVAAKFIKEHEVDLMLVGVRKTEGGARSSAYKNCFSEITHYGCSQYRPIFWYTTKDKRDYELLYDVSHSRCYSDYGLNRTGCCGCPFGKDFEYELESVKLNEPKLYKAVSNIFSESYEYTRQYYQYKRGGK